MDEGKAFVLGLDFGGTKIDVGAAALDGRLLASDRIDTDASRGAEQAVERAVRLARELAERTAAATDGVCVGVGAVSPGIVREERVLLAPNVPGWGELALPAVLGEQLEVESVTVGNDVNAAALAEARWGALRGADPGLLVSLGTGIAAGIVIGGKVFTGAHGAAGEIGYSLRHPADDIGFARGHAPLEEFVGGRAIGDRAGQVVGERLSAADAFRRQDLPSGFIEETLAELSMHIANMAIVLDPARIAVGGGLMAHGEVILRALRRRLEVAVPFPPTVEPATFLHDGGLHGAVALALDSVGESLPAAAAVAR
jgi:predicted NBD/HSP70 family sugar kinase